MERRKAEALMRELDELAEEYRKRLYELRYYYKVSKVVTEEEYEKYYRSERGADVR